MSRTGWAIGGAILGGVVGFFLGGPAGAVVGAAIGAGLAYGMARWVDSLQLPEPAAPSSTGAWSDDQWAPSDRCVPVIYGAPRCEGLVVYSGARAQVVSALGAAQLVEPAAVMHVCVAWGEGPVTGICGLTVDDVPVEAIEGASYTHYLGTADQGPDSRFVTVRQRVEMGSPQWWEWNPNAPDPLEAAPKTVTFVPAEDGATAWVQVRWTAAARGSDTEKPVLVRLEYRPNGAAQWTDAGLHLLEIPKGQTGPFDCFLPIGDPTATDPVTINITVTREQELVWTSVDGNPENLGWHYLPLTTTTPTVGARATAVALRPLAGGVPHEARLTVVRFGRPPGIAEYAAASLSVPAVEVEERLGAQPMRLTAYTALSLPRRALQSQAPRYKAVVLGRPVEVWEGGGLVPRWTNNPVWCARDLIANARYGLALPGVCYDGESDAQWGGARLAALACEAPVSTLDTCAVTAGSRRWEWHGTQGSASVFSLVPWIEGQTQLTLYRAGVQQAVTATYAGTADGRLVLSNVSNAAFAWAEGDRWRVAAGGRWFALGHGAPLVSYAVTGFADGEADYSGYLAVRAGVETRLVGYHDRRRGRLVLPRDFATAPTSLALREQRFRFDGALQRPGAGLDVAREILTHARALLWEDEGRLRFGVELAAAPVGEIDAVGGRAAANAVVNPGFEAGTLSGWTVWGTLSGGRAVEASPAQVYRGGWAARIHHPAEAASYALGLRTGGAYPLAVVPGDVVTVQFVYAGDRPNYTHLLASSGGNVLIWSAMAYQDIGGGWTRATYTWTSDRTATMGLLIGFTGAQALACYVDCVQMEFGPEATEWVDGRRLGGVAEGSVEVWVEREDELPDALICRYTDPDAGHQNREVTVGEVKSGGYTDSREWKGCLNVRQAQRLGWHALRLARLPRRARVRTPLGSVGLEPGDVVLLYAPEGAELFGYDLADPDRPARLEGQGMAMRVVAVADDPEADERTVLLREYAAEAYLDDPGLHLPERQPDTRPLGPPPTPESVTATWQGRWNDDYTMWRRLVTLQWIQPTPALVVRWEVYQSQDATHWTLAAETTVPHVELELELTGWVFFRVVPVSLAGLRGPWESAQIAAVPMGSDLTILPAPVFTAAEWTEHPRWAWEWAAGEAPPQIFKGYWARLLVEIPGFPDGEETDWFPVGNSYAIPDVAARWPAQTYGDWRNLGFQLQVYAMSISNQGGMQADSPLVYAAAPAAPTGLGASFSDAPRWQWDPAPEPWVIGYQVSLDAGQTWRPVADPWYELSAPTQRSYSLRVRAVAASGREGPATADVEAARPAPQAPSLAYLLDELDGTLAVLSVAQAAPRSLGHVGWRFQWMVDGGSQWLDVAEEPAAAAVWHGLAKIDPAALPATVLWRYAEVDDLGPGAWSQATHGVVVIAPLALLDLDEATVAGESTLPPDETEVELAAVSQTVEAGQRVVVECEASVALHVEGSATGFWVECYYQLYRGATVIAAGVRNRLEVPNTGAQVLTVSQPFALRHTDHPPAGEHTYTLTMTRGALAEGYSAAWAKVSQRTIRLNRMSG
jgi:hypothetical protein